MITFEFQENGSWDNEQFRIFLNDAMAVGANFSSGASSIQSYSTTSFGNGNTYAITSDGTTGSTELHTVTLTLNDTSLWGTGDLKLGFGSTLDEIYTNENWGIDNVQLTVTEINGVSVTLPEEAASDDNDAGDIIYAGAGDDTVYSGAGDDTVYGESGTDYVYAGSGDDTIDGGTDADIIIGGLGNDTISGGDDNDILIGSGGDDILNGGAGNDIIAGDYLTSQTTKDTFENGTAGWNYSFDLVNNTSTSGLGNFLGRFGQQAYTSQTITVDPTETSLTLQFDFLEIGGWDIEAMYFTVNNVQYHYDNFNYEVQSGGTVSTYQSSLTRVSSGAVDFGIGDFAGNYWDQLHTYTFTFYDRSLYADGTIKFGFYSNTNESYANESWGLDNVTVTGASETVYLDQDFTDETEANDWVGTHNFNQNEFLGVFGTQNNFENSSSGNQFISKSFDVNQNVTQLALTFDMYEIDSWDNEAFKIYLNDSEVISVIFGSTSSVSETAFGTGNTYAMTSGAGTIAPGSTNLSGNANYADELHTFTLTLNDSSLWSDGILKLGFGTTLDEVLSNEAFAVDNVQLLATEVNDIALTNPMDLLDAGSGADDTITGGAGDDIMTGGAGRDIFVWNSGDDGTAATPTIDTITDFIVANNGDVLDLSGLLENETIETLTDYISFSVENNNTILSIKPSGGDGDVTQKIVLENVDLTEGGVYNDQQIIDALITNNQLNTDF